MTQESDPTKTTRSIWSKRVEEYEDAWAEACKINDVEEREERQCMVLSSISDEDLMVIQRLLERSMRLRSGSLTDSEIQNLCHNNPHVYDRFCDGCDEYQKKLFGKCRSDDLRSEVRGPGPRDIL